MQGGVGDCTNEIARAVIERGVEVSVLTSARDEGRGTWDKVETADYPLTSDQRLTTNDLQVFRVVKKWDWSVLELIRHALEVTRADIFHIEYQTAAFGMQPMINFAPRLLNLYPFAPRPRGRGGRGARSVVTFHDLLPAYLFPRAGPVRDWVTFQLARSCDAVIATNDEDAARLELVLQKSVSLIPIGSNIDPTPPPNFDREALRAQLGIQSDEILLCYFGFLNESKGGETLIRALAELPNAKLLMLGGQTGVSDPTNEQYLARVKQMIDDLHLTPRVIWTDFMPQAQVSAYFFASDMCVLPYRDGASYRRGTFMAALAHGMAIVTTRVSDLTPMMRQDDALLNSTRVLTHLPSPTRRGELPPLCDGENVMLVRADDSHAIAGAVKRIAADPELCKKLRNGARTTAEFFMWDKIADAHLALYEQLLDKS